MSKSQSQSDERVRQMSKQEDFLLKRKREIEQNLKKQQSDFPALKTEPKHELQEHSSSITNKFSNDGSFFEQFKKLTNSTIASNAVKKEDSIANPVSSKESKFKMRSTIQEHQTSRLPNYVPDLPPVCDTQKVPMNPAVDKFEPNVKQDIKTESEADPSQSDWFQEAVKRAKEKARELSSTSSTPVSISEQREECESKKRSSRWGETSQQTVPVTPSLVIPPAVTQQKSFNMPNTVMGMVGEGQHMEAICGIMITKLTRNNPAINAYAMKVFGSLDLTDAQWKQCEEQMKMNIVFQLLQEKQKEAKRLEMEGRVKYEYDSDEDIEGGTWEHKRRKKEMEQTAVKAVELTRSAEGKHHIGDFLPPEELASFVEKYTALKEGRDPDLSDYKEHRLTEENVGYKMLKSMGWTEGSGLGADGKGIMAPINQKGQSENQGLGAGVVNNLSMDDDEYDAYRKRMMLAYRFRPNPLNNPRRAYY